MINRIREIRKARGMTLADLAAACQPETTAQTIGRLETGMRNLSTKWMERIGAALGVDPQVLVGSDKAPRAQVIAQLGLSDPEALKTPRDAVLPSEMAAQEGDEPMLVLEVTSPVGEYRPGDTVWLRQMDAWSAKDADFLSAMNRDCLVPRPGGRFAFGRLIDRRGPLVGILPTQAGQKQQVIDNPDWIAVAVMLVRPL
ncbi:XRE family transcriptional regulator [Erythrobacter longus]|uniref:XRE family transcriptional regulator n=1 Tax=Erythrobacter longus TaxID=1044 RepID=A0A074M7L2_ERYLO|nr:helix-turn-helix transcriptional regulator [Erythrobacter longus]KEO90736.1 XRE family transcriptional regulator [Erythrobacter longus]